MVFKFWGNLFFAILRTASTWQMLLHVYQMLFLHNLFRKKKISSNSHFHYFAA